MEGGDKKVSVGPGTGVVGNHKSKKLKFLWLRILVVVLILAAVIAYVSYVFSPLKQKETPDNGVGGTDLNEIEDCLEMERVDLDCNFLLSASDTKYECKKLGTGELRDKCYYEIALIEFDESLCKNIQDEKLKQDCGLDTVLNEENE